jgi:hypothetical protein
LLSTRRIYKTAGLFFVGAALLICDEACGETFDEWMSRLPKQAVTFGDLINVTGGFGMSADLARSLPGKTPIQSRPTISHDHS